MDWIGLVNAAASVATAVGKREAADSFNELRMLELKDNFKSVPRRWGKNWRQELRSLQAKSAKQPDK